MRAIKKNISRKENKQNPWPFLIFTPPHHICGLHRDRRADVCYQQHLSMLVCVCVLCSSTLQRAGVCSWVYSYSDISRNLSPLRRDRCWALLPTTKRNVILRFATSPASRPQSSMHSCLLFRLFLFFSLHQSNSFWTGSHHYTTFT